MSNDYQDFGFVNADASHMHRHFMPKVFELAGELKPGTRVLDVGCGNGFTCGEFLKRGCTVVGIDLSEQGIAQARQALPSGRFELLPADDQVLQRLGEEPFDIVVSTEVVEHLYDPRSYVRGCFGALKPGGQFICTTPYHGCVKKPGRVPHGEMGLPCRSLVGRRAHQTLEPPEADRPPDGGRFRRGGVPGRGPSALALDDHGPQNFQTGGCRK